MTDSRRIPSVSFRQTSRLRRILLKRPALMPVQAPPRGAVAGGVLGGRGGGLVGIGALAIPGVGPFIAAGAFATALGGAAIGAGLGAIAGALVGMGVPEEHARYYEGEAKAGKTLVTVRADRRYE